MSKTEIIVLMNIDLYIFVRSQFCTIFCDNFRKFKYFFALLNNAETQDPMFTTYSRDIYNRKFNKNGSIFKKKEKRGYFI